MTEAGTESLDGACEPSARSTSHYAKEVHEYVIGRSHDKINPNHRVLLISPKYGTFFLHAVSRRPRKWVPEHTITSIIVSCNQGNM